MQEPGGPAILLDVVRRQKSGVAVGLPSICSANSFVIDAALRQAAADGTPILIEATCNQVNQSGGYSGMTPRQFASQVRGIAAQAGCPEDQILLGGDHLGPFPWRNESADAAMAKAAVMVRDYAEAGFDKIHLDASMACAGDPPVLAAREIAGRAALLCEAAETAGRSRGSVRLPCYVIGSEVPAPGGMGEEMHAPRVTDPRDVSNTVEAFRRAFAGRSLTEAWRRVWAVVVQPGVEFSDEQVFEYDPAAASGLAGWIRGLPDMVFEAHSTDYQPAAALRAMVRDQFAILKVGPALTFAFRRAVFALERIEIEWLGKRRGVHLSGTTLAVMSALQDDPHHWQRHYAAGGRDTVGAVMEGRLDRVRYYWTVPKVERALRQLFRNLEANPAPTELVSRHLPNLSQKIATAAVANAPRAVLDQELTSVLADYRRACAPES